MITSLTFRHGTEHKTNRDKVTQALSELSVLYPRITRTQLVFSKETHHAHHDDLITCHLSIHIPNHDSIEIYERQPSVIEALDKTISCAKRRIVRAISKSEKSTNKTVILQLLEDAS